MSYGGHYRIQIQQKKLVQILRTNGIKQHSGKRHEHSQWLVLVCRNVSRYVLLIALSGSDEPIEYVVPSFTEHKLKYEIGNPAVLLCAR